MAAQQASAIEVTVNGELRQLRLDPATTILAALRQNLGLMGTRTACLEGYCGACTVLLNGRPVQACTVSLSAAADGSITTIEAISHVGCGEAVVTAFLEEQAAQCAYCINGIIMSVTGMLGQDPPASRSKIIAALDERHLCRCGAQPRILRAIDRAIASREAGR